MSVQIKGILTMPEWEIVLGLGLLLAWATFLVWGLAEMAIAEWKGNCHYGSPLLNLIAGAALGAGVVLGLKLELRDLDMFGAAMVLAIASVYWIFVCGYSIRHPHRKQW
jgi:hypothetical protein